MDSQCPALRKDLMVGYVRIFFLAVGSLCFSGCDDGPSPLKDFSSDGCSLFPDQSLITNKDWCDCCFDHDLAYWRGGTEEERELADLELMECVMEKTGDETLAELMYQGVRLGGSPYFYNWYRWGYGWNYGREYEALSEEDKALVEAKLGEYFASESPGYCGR